MLGEVLQVYSATECQGRTLLHFHCLVWTRFTAQHISELARTGRMHLALRVIESQLLTDMPERYFQDREQQWADCDHIAPAGLLLDSIPYGQRLELTVARFQHHYQLKPTCFKGAIVQCAKFCIAVCRLCFKRPPCDERGSSG